MVKVFVLGATGGTGRAVVSRAVAAGHDVTVLVRDPARRACTSWGGAHVVVGDATDPEVLREGVRGREVVLSAIGSRDLRHPIELTVTAALLSAIATGEVRRLIVCSAFGVGATLQDAAERQRQFFTTTLRHVFEAKARADAAVRNSGLDWTLVYPTRLTDAPEEGPFRVAEHFTGAGQISRAAVAAFMVDQIGSSAWSRKTAIITSASHEH